MIYIYLKSYNINLLNHFCNDILPILGLNKKGPIFLPKENKKYTVIRSPHVNSLSREEFKVYIFRRSFIVKRKRIVKKRGINSLQQNIVKDNLNFIRKKILKRLPAGISVRLSFKSLHG